MQQIYGSTAGVFMVLAVVCSWFYMRDQERAALGLTLLCVVLCGSALAEAVNSTLLPWLVPITFAGLAASWWLTRGGTKGA